MSCSWRWNPNKILYNDLKMILEILENLHCPLQCPQKMQFCHYLVCCSVVYWNLITMTKLDYLWYFKYFATSQFYIRNQYFCHNCHSWIWPPWSWCCRPGWCNPRPFCSNLWSYGWSPAGRGLCGNSRGVELNLAPPIAEAGLDLFPVTGCVASSGNRVCVRQMILPAIILTEIDWCQISLAYLNHPWSMALIAFQLRSRPLKPPRSTATT